MTRKIYKSAMGKPVDLGALLLQNEQVRAVGNMNVNARGDRLDSANRVIEPKNRQVQRKYNKQSNVSAGPTAVSTRATKPAEPAVADTVIPSVDPTDTFADLPVDDPADIPAPVVQADTGTTPADVPKGGLAAALARSREVKQELEKTQRQKMQSQGVRKI
jgi:hypothetical protein